MTIPYASASAGVRARDEITKILRRLGCDSIGWMDDFEKHEVLLAFKQTAPLWLVAARHDQRQRHHGRRRKRGIDFATNT
jgi:hypothetical protein